MAVLDQFCVNRNGLLAPGAPECAVRLIDGFDFNGTRTAGSGSKECGKGRVVHLPCPLKRLGIGGPFQLRVGYEVGSAQRAGWSSRSSAQCQHTKVSGHILDFKRRKDAGRCPQECDGDPQDIILYQHITEAGR